MAAETRPGQLVVRAALFAVKLGVAALLVGWLVTQRRLNLALITHLPATPRVVALFGIAAVAVFAGLLIMSWRLQQLLRHVELDIPYRAALGLTLIGSFIGAVLPGLVGGDLVKTVYLCRQTARRRAEAVAAVLIDRAIGLYALLCLAVLALPLVNWWHLTRLDRHVAWLVLALWAGATLGGLVLAVRPWARRPARPGDPAPGLLRRLAQAGRAYAAAPRLVAASILLSMLNHLLVVGSFFAVGVLLGDPLPFHGHLVITPLAMLLNAIPLAPGGVGITESGFSLLFEHAGSPNGAAVGLLGRILQYVVFALGGLPALLLLKLTPSDVAAEEAPRPVPEEAVG